MIMGPIISGVPHQLVFKQCQFDACGRLGYHFKLSQSSLEPIKSHACNL